MRLAAGADHWSLAAFSHLLDVESTGIADQKVTMAGALTMREQQNALLAQSIAAISGENVEQIMRVARTFGKPLHEIVIFRAPEALRFGDKTCCCQPYLAARSGCRDPAQAACCSRRVGCF